MGTIPAIVNNCDNHERAGVLTMQALRSASNWSLGRLEVENSIMQCYKEIISKSQKYIYIENQFFISSTSGVGVENDLVQCLFERIKVAVETRQKFKVIVFMPLMPAFEANLEDQQGKVMQIQIALQNLTIAKGEKSLISQLRKVLGQSGIIPEEYVQICGLRKWQPRPTDGKPITELIYIHSKVGMFLSLVDDSR
jgi:phospholipase D1/2